MDEKLSEFRRWLVEEYDSRWDRRVTGDGLDAGRYLEVREILDEFDERFGA